MDLRFCVAPMMDWTDRHCRAFHRVLSRRARLYTEMVTTGAVLHGDRERLLGFDAVEHPVAVQLGGSDPRDLAASARICADLGYDEVNLNVGCPSDRVQNGAFGACLMREPALVGDCVAAMKAAVAVPVTVKCRLGVDEQGLEALDHLADAVLAAGADALIVHARKAWLKGLSPRENRDVPPLDYEAVYALKRRLPHVPIALNGGLTGFDQIATALDRLDGVMVGRAAYGDPALLLEVDARIYGETATAPARLEALEAYLPYISARLAEGVPLHAMTRHMLGLFNTWPRARAWRRHLSVEGVKRGAGLDVVREAAAEVRAPEALVAA
ncbi:tRNA-dihydrouridine synthase A [Beijerinckiaceae bacterium RH AL1]|nr:tRNA dihydrouridine(20/20a) synthase DusA [Beijerinckiaceae bacterium]VVB44355.1 tRNA-dihydrouridine synthase A [Beijerinckiaceae bacterium RH CH11]VVB44435.1 tRNA-dihydrouridine synthase A [Beijerinckiaceae bacterium RH AL8]VVC54312.1 tRNA-dihydrouridine synthase A [Beijerinckiaceae bacterium RH AL1]